MRRRPPRPPLNKIARAKQKNDEKNEKDKRVRLLCDIISTGQYIPYITPTELGKQWGLSRHSVEGMAAQAARHIRLCLSEDDIVGSTLLSGLQLCFAKAVEKNQTGDVVKAALGIVGIREKFGFEKRRTDMDKRSETFEVELALIDEARRAAEENAAPAPPPKPGQSGQGDDGP